MQDGHGPFESVQAAMDALGLPKDKRPKHQQWDRLSAQLKEQIPPTHEVRGEREMIWS